MTYLLLNLSRPLHLTTLNRPMSYTIASQRIAIGLTGSGPMEWTLPTWNTWTTVERVRSS